MTGNPSHPHPPTISGRPELPEHFFRTNNRGLVEAVCARTGRVLAVQASQYDLLEQKWERLVKIDTPQGPVWIEKGLNFDMIGVINEMPYSRLLADLICEHVCNGASIKDAAEKVGVSYRTLCRWRRDIDEFKVALKQAKEDRAEGHFDEALATAKKSKRPYLEVETLKWAAEKGNQAEFGTPNKNTIGVGSAQVIVVHTGILRPGDAGYENAQLKEVQPQPTIEARKIIPEEDEIAEYVGVKE